MHFRFLPAPTPRHAEPPRPSPLPLVWSACSHAALTGHKEARRRGTRLRERRKGVTQSPGRGGLELSASGVPESETSRLEGRSGTTRNTVPDPSLLYAQYLAQDTGGELGINVKRASLTFFVRSEVSRNQLTVRSLTPLK